MKKMIALMIVGMFVLVGCGTVVMGEPDDPVGSNRAPGAPIIMDGQSRMEGKEYHCFFYAVDPDGDEVYYDLSWEKIDNKDIATCGSDDPVYPWLGPFNSGEEVNELRECCESGDYELTIRVKDEFGKEGPSTTVTVSYTKAEVLQCEPDDPVGSNRAPGAPIIMEGQSRMEGKEYQCFFYAVDPDGDEVYYDLSWEKIDDKAVATCGPDDPVYPWLGPFNSGEEVKELRECCESGDYELTIRVKDEFDLEGPSTTVTVSYAKALQLPFARILARYPGFVYFLTKIFKF